MIASFRTFSFQELSKPTLTFYLFSLLLCIGYWLLNQHLILSTTNSNSFSNQVFQTKTVRVEMKYAFSTLEKTMAKFKRPETLETSINCFQNVCDITFKNKYRDNSEAAILAESIYESQIPIPKKSAN
ncbi:hypothetical protein [Pseudoalteromonas sp.]|uniref:hypothetical protein n=1 Tax=Pseudoalteromonas sp. TaxID=53249 RepID=UPI003561773E